MKKVITLFVSLTFTLILFAAPTGGPTSITISQGAINGFLNAATPISGTKSIQLFAGAQQITYTLSNLDVTIQSGSMPFTGNVSFKTSTLSTSAAITGTMMVHYDSSSKSIILEMNNLNSNNPTVLSLIQTLQAVGMFKIQYPIKTQTENFPINQMGTSKQIQSQFTVQSITMQPGNLVLTGNVTFQSTSAKTVNGK